MRARLSGSRNEAFGKTWFTDGETNVRAFEPPEGFVKGMTKRRKEAR